MLGAKTCDYQLRDGRDLLCSARGVRKLRCRLWAV